MIVSDTNILSSFIVTDSLDWLLTALQTDDVIVPSAVWNELEAAAARGRVMPDELTALRASGQVRIMELSANEQRQSDELPNAFGAGEKESLILAIRLAATLLSNDRRVVNYCRAQGITCFDLRAVLRYIWIRQIASQLQVRQLMRRMTEREGIVFKNAERVFEQETR